jgi:hypothetical protein
MRSERMRVLRQRRKAHTYRRSIDVTDMQPDALEKHGYLDPDRPGDRTDERDAIEMFLGDSLNK